MFDKIFRQRTALVWLAPILCLLVLWALDPDTGPLAGKVELPGIVVWVLMAARVCLVVSIAHWVRKAMFDYVDLKTAYLKAVRDPIGAAMVLLAIVAFLISTMWLLSGTAKAGQCVDEVVKARPYMPTLQAEQRAAWPDHPKPYLLASLAGHESGCPCMKKCWEPEQQFKGKFKDTGTQREEGGGIPQATRAWRKDGSLRFDALQEMSDRHKELATLTWDNLYQRADLQMRFMVLMMRDNYQGLRVVRDPWQRLAFADAGYNGGMGGVQSERMACGVRAGCDPQKWFGNVDGVCLKSKAAMYGQRSACDINRHHVMDVLVVRAPKYAGAM